jgi:hypothetical protein
VHVTVNGWSTSKIPKWALTANVSTWEGASGRFGATTQPSPCKLDKGGAESLANGDTFDLRLEASRDAVENSWVRRAPHEPASAGPERDRGHVALLVRRLLPHESLSLRDGVAAGLACGTASD